jgi:hypothetical protein
VACGIAPAACISTHRENPGADLVVPEACEGCVVIEATTIDSLVRELGLERLDFIKLDIEGSEVRALQGAAGSLRGFRPRLAVSTEHTDDILGNNRAVLETLKDIEPRYEAQCRECHREHWAVTPYVPYFTCS